MGFLDNTGLQYFVAKLKQNIIPASDKGAANGVATLGSDGKLAQFSTRLVMPASPGVNVANLSGLNGVVINSALRAWNIGGVGIITGVVSFPDAKAAGYVVKIADIPAQYQPNTYIRYSTSTAPGAYWAYVSIQINAIYVTVIQGTMPANRQIDITACYPVLA